MVKIATFAKPQTVGGHAQMKTRFQILSLLTVFLLNCSPDKGNTSRMTADKFTWDIQLAGYDYNQYNQKGETDFSNFISEFDKFPWLEQLDSYQQIQKGCSPTLSVKDKGTKTSFWVSMAGDRNDHGYLIGYVYPKEKKGLLGLGKTKEIKWLEIYLTTDTQLVKDCFKLYFDRDFSKLETKIRLLEKYDEMEAKN